MKNLARLSLYLLVAMLTITCFNSCKFVFSESEYLGTYPGNFESETPVYKSCNGQVILIDAGNNMVNLELVTDSNPTFYYNNLTVQRGYSLYSSDLLIDGDGINAYLSRTTH